MLRYALGRLLALLPVWLVVSLVVFLLIRSPSSTWAGSAGPSAATSASPSSWAAP